MKRCNSRPLKSVAEHLGAGSHFVDSGARNCVMFDLIETGALVACNPSALLSLFRLAF